jgi:predicted transposase YdaD
MGGFPRAAGKPTHQLKIGRALEQDDHLGKDERGIMTNLEAVYEEWREKTSTLGRQEGEQRGRQEGRQAIVLRLLSRRVGVLSAKVRSQITHLSAEQLEALAEALLDFSGTEDLVAWLKDC